MNKITLTLLLVVLIGFTTSAQTTSSPYEWDWTRDGIWTGTALAGGAIGYKLIIDKDDITEDKLNSLNKDDINFADRWLAGTFDEDAIIHSYIPFGISFAAPLVLLFDHDINDHTGQVLGLYLESLSTTAAMYTITAGLANRSRPYVYNTDGKVTQTKRLQNNGQRSFYSGHVAATATASFFAAKVFSDFNPDSPAKPYIWAGAAALPAAVGYFRLKAGQHFLTDVILGYALGAATGYFVPELHKAENENLDVYPTSGRTFMGDDYSGMAVRYTF